MKVVAISQRVDNFPDRSEKRDALDQCLIELILKCGYLPVPVPNGLCEFVQSAHSKYEIFNRWVDAVNPQGVILSGGNDIGRCIDRDLTETELLNYAIKHELPVLGICRGMQMMATWSGADLRQIQGHVRTRHIISGEIAGEVNSFHNYSLDICPSDYKVIAKSEDGAIEAIRHTSRKWEGWMWHPEREMGFINRDIYRIKALFGE